ncbi:MAG: cation-translocating P-type ATPase [Patescibacteria group bacterium]
MKNEQERSWESNFYHKDTKEVVEIFSTDPDVGLNSAEAEKRLNEFGPNKLPKSKPDTVFRIFIRQFKSPLIYLLLVASAVLLFLGDTVDAVVILAVLLFNSVLGSFQEGKAQNALEALKKIATSEALVLRDGVEKVVEDSMLVPGDIITLHDGDKIPADARILSVNNFKVSESVLTGESKPVPKKEKTLEEKELTPADQINMVFKGTYVVSGNAKAVVVATGLDTMVGAISAKLGAINTEVPLKHRIEDLSGFIIRTILLIAVAVFLLGVLTGEDVYSMLLVVIAIVVSTIPEGLPVVITLVLATGVWRMSKRNALVKRLQAVEALGQAKVIAVDKTGTITRNELMVNEVLIDGKNLKVTGVGYKNEGEIKEENGQVLTAKDSPTLERLAEVGAFTSDAWVSYNEEEDIWQVSGDPTEAAIKVFAEKGGVIKENMEDRYKRVFEIPFSSDNKFHAVINRKEEGDGLSLAGAPEVVLSKSESIFEKGETRSLSEEEKEEIKRKVYEMSERGLRVIAFAFSENVGDRVREEEMPPLTFLGLVAMSDVRREGVKEAVERVRQAGVDLVMITGDHKITARAIAKEVGIYKEGDRIILGSELDSLTPEDLASALPSTSVFARVTPEHKLKIIEGYRKLGQVVAMTGDGVNDALSLASADLGVSMGKTGTEVAKEASDIILLDDNFGTIISAMEEGRAIFNRIKRVVMYLFSTGLGEIFTITAAIVLGLPLPLLAAQIIWLNVLTDGILVAPLSMDPKEKDILKRKFRKPKRWVIDKFMASRVIVMGATMATVTLFLFYHYLPDLSRLEGLSDEGFEDLMRKPWTVSLTMLAVFQWFNIWNVRTTTSSIFSRKLFSNKWLLLTMAAAVLSQIAVVYVPFLQDVFRTASLSLSDWGIILSFGLIIILVEEVRKLIARIRNKKT